MDLHAINNTSPTFGTKKVDGPIRKSLRESHKKRLVEGRRQNKWHYFRKLRLSRKNRQYN